MKPTQSLRVKCGTVGNFAEVWPHVEDIEKLNDLELILAFEDASQIMCTGFTFIDHYRGFDNVPDSDIVDRKLNAQNHRIALMAAIQKRMRQTLACTKH